MELPIKLSADRRTRQVGNFTSPKLRSIQGPLTDVPVTTLKPDKSLPDFSIFF